MKKWVKVVKRNKLPIYVNSRDLMYSIGPIVNNTAL